MNVFTQLKAEHDRVKQLMERLAATPDSGEERRVRFAEIRRDLIAHAKAEDYAFYKELEDDDELHDKIETARAEHAAIEELLDELMQSERTDDVWLLRFATLRKSVEQHVREEERDVFPMARTVLDSEDAEVLGRALATKEAEVRLRL